MDELSNRLEKTYSGILYDVLRSMGHPDCLLPNTIRPLLLDKKIAGRVFTISGRIVEDMNEHDSLVQWCTMLSKAPTDHVMVCQPNDSTVSHMGELSSEVLSYKKVRGYIVDGGVRDSEFIEKVGFPVWNRYFTPRDVVGRWVPESFDKAIIIGDVTINPGDYTFADRDGVVIIPADIAEAVCTRAEELIGTENLVRKAILEGVDPVDAYLKYGKF
ncbi:RraA family protein [Lentisphaera profundi]|uniref:Putative 4-hydroxy-4-methyl-2-oxoglutarate aldolase n=1 Tax=Lentisphaera profundi TaxID=1658616 RepID=A0ABY7VUZ0_9BACT|nr:RraA family protein [Lentisphaera profundi]WDE97564.1 RraA family protein [Lentisphaera profundi]